MEQLYNDFSRWIRQRFPYRVQKISIDAGFTCPNRDGSVGYGGCIYCDNKSFNPQYCNSIKSVCDQIKDGKAFFGRKYPDMKYLAYFQAYTNTYGSIDRLKSLYEEALSADDVVGIVIGTRPDCVPKELLDYLEGLNRHTFVLVEYGIETTNDETLKLINRGHDFASTKAAIEATAERGILTGGHVILGLPGEDAKESISQAKTLSQLPLDILKVHQMQIIKGTALAEMYKRNPFHIYSADEYIELVTAYIQHLRPSLVLERFVSQSPAGLLVAPKWGLKNYEFTNLLNNHLRKVHAWQGQLFTE